MDALGRFSRRLMGGQVLPWRARPGQTLGVRWQTLSSAEQYRMLRAYRECNGLYSQVADAYQQVTPREWQEALRPLRNPTSRIIEAYVATVMAGPLAQALPIETENERILAPIQQVWAWSNWGSQKQVAMRLLAMLGDLFIKVRQRRGPGGRPDRVFFELLDPEWVTDFSTDERGYLVYLRIDVPQTHRRGDTVEASTYTEVWDKAEQRFRYWEHDRPWASELSQLGTPIEDQSLSAFGINFVPVVHVMFRDVGKARGEAAIVPIIDKIDEANRVATRLHQILYRHNKPLWALHGSGNDATGRPIPAPLLDGAETDGTLTVGDESVLGLPGTTQMTPLVPALNYASHLAALDAMMLEIERDAPAMAYGRVRELAATSGVAIRYLLTDFIQSVEEVRGNVYDALARLDEMALTIGQAPGLFGRDIGTYEAGDFTHGFAGPPVIPLSDIETAQARLARAQAEGAEAGSGVHSLHGILKASGYTDEQADLELEQIASRDVLVGVEPQ